MNVHSFPRLTVLVTSYLKLPGPQRDPPLALVRGERSPVHHQDPHPASDGPQEEVCRIRSLDPLDDRPAGSLLHPEQPQPAGANSEPGLSVRLSKLLKITRIFGGIAQR